MGVCTPVTQVSYVWFSEAFATEGFFASFLLNELLLASTLCLLFSFLIFAYVPVVVLVGLGFVVLVDG